MNRGLADLIMTIPSAHGPYNKATTVSHFLRKCTYTYTYTYHTNIPPISIPALHSPLHLKTQPLINPHIRLIPRTLQIALPSLPVRNTHHLLKQLPPNPPSLRSRTHSNDITKVVPPLIIPNRLLRFRLSRFPDIVPSHVQSAMPSMPEVIQPLPEPE